MPEKTQTNEQLEKNSKEIELSELAPLNNNVKPETSNTNHRAESSFYNENSQEVKINTEKNDKCSTRKKGKLIIISGPSGVGKGTIINQLFANKI